MRRQGGGLTQIFEPLLSLLCLAGMCQDAGSGMEYLESKQCIHRDLAARYRNCYSQENTCLIWPCSGVVLDNTIHL